jgi:hypothetical protein
MEALKIRGGDLVRITVERIGISIKNESRNPLMAQGLPLALSFASHFAAVMRRQDVAKLIY